MSRTPGEWTVHPATKADQKRGLCVVADAGGINQCVAICPVVVAGTREGNAELIAAAPDMLEALKHVVAGQLDHLVSLWGDEDIARTVREKVHAAIAKAEGGPS